MDRLSIWGVVLTALAAIGAALFQFIQHGRKNEIDKVIQVNEVLQEENGRLIKRLEKTEKKLEATEKKNDELRRRVDILEEENTLLREEMSQMQREVAELRECVDGRK